jgi:hypothetical protein
MAENFELLASYKIWNKLFAYAILVWSSASVLDWLLDISSILVESIITLHFIAASMYVAF